MILSDTEFVEAFESCRLPPDQFHHRDHLRLAWIYLQRYSSSESSARLAESIRRYAAHHGKAEKYHETVTIVWFRLLDDAAARANPTGFDALLAACPELLDKNTLQEYYSSELLASETARLNFVPADRKPLPD